ncbi:hypothetical protein NPIL_72531 [Nephila pilipes]|uniref:Uncharacterized protein n=1 Tax=Nephila pilipes TaxID=299642 RepID=A0A8X6PTS8_NEPPI|nr:hypothetical protein NPIL_72531 [Nephila pilipes]
MLKVVVRGLPSDYDIKELINEYKRMIICNWVAASALDVIAPDQPTHFPHRGGTAFIKGILKHSGFLNDYILGMLFMEQDQKGNVRRNTSLENEKRIEKKRDKIWDYSLLFLLI